MGVLLRGHPFLGILTENQKNNHLILVYFHLGGPLTQHTQGAAPFFSNANTFGGLKQSTGLFAKEQWPNSLRSEPSTLIKKGPLAAGKIQCWEFQSAQAWVDGLHPLARSPEAPHRWDGAQCTEGRPLPPPCPAGKCADGNFQQREHPISGLIQTNQQNDLPADQSTNWLEAPAPQKQTRILLDK